MRFVLALIVTAGLISLLSVPLRRHPVPFYILAIVLDGLYLYGASIGAAAGLWAYFMPLMQRCALAFVLFSVVMFVGVLSKTSPVRSYLLSLRRQLSILACIFASCHVIHYAVLYLPRAASSMPVGVVASLALSALLVVIMAALLVTSFIDVKAKMKAVTWKRVQRLAYPFYLGMYAHLALLLAPSAFAGKDTAIVSLAIYTVVIGTYIALRIRRSVLEANNAASKQVAAPAPITT